MNEVRRNSFSGNATLYKLAVNNDTSGNITTITSSIIIVLRCTANVVVSVMEEKLREQALDSERRSMAIRSIAIATLAVTTCMISLPIVFTRLQEVDSLVHSELEECMVRNLGGVTHRDNTDNRLLAYYGCSDP